jgi:hypothetical protein
MSVIIMQITRVLFVDPSSDRCRRTHLCPTGRTFSHGGVVGRLPRKEKAKRKNEKATGHVDGPKARDSWMMDDPSMHTSPSYPLVESQEKAGVHIGH